MTEDEEYRSPLTSDRQNGIQSRDEHDTNDAKTKRNRYVKWAVPLLAEFLAMLFFTFIHCMGTHSLPFTVSAFNDGFIVAIVIVTIGPISGALINPAVTIAVALSGGLKWAMVPFCIAVQLTGSLCGAALAKIACGSPSGYFALGPGINVVQGLLTEAMLTVVLVFTALQSTTDIGPPIAAFAVGFSVICDILVGAKISGAAMNPALSFGPAAVAGAWDHYWIYWLGPLSGACVAVALHKLAMASRKIRDSIPKRRSNRKDSMKKRDYDETNQVSAV